VSKPVQQDPKRFFLNLVRPETTPDDPDHIDREKTLEARKTFSEKGLPLLARSAHAAFGGVITPNQTEMELFKNSNPHARICGHCRNFEYGKAQEVFNTKRYLFLLRELMGGVNAAQHLGDLRKWGECRATGAMTAWYTLAASCPDFAPQRTFLKSVGGIISRLTEY